MFDTLFLWNHDALHPRCVGGSHAVGCVLKHQTPGVVRPIREATGGNLEDVRGRLAVLQF